MTRTVIHGSAPHTVWRKFNGGVPLPRQHDMSRPLYDANGNPYEGCHVCGMDRLLMDLKGDFICPGPESGPSVFQQGLSLLNQVKP